MAEEHKEKPFGNYLLKEHSAKDERPMLPCHPRDLLGLDLAMIQYKDEPAEITPDTLRDAWQSYFVRM